MASPSMVRLTPVETDVRYCSRCRRDWPSDTESCPNCLLWLGQARRQRRHYRVELDRAPRPATNSARTWDERVVLSLELSVNARPDNDAIELLTAFLRRFDEVVVAHGGELVRGHDDRAGMLALFPAAEDDAAARLALAAALTLRSAAQPLTEQLRRLDAACTIALNVGPVYRDGRQDPALVRSGVVSQAQRLLASATSATVAVTQAIFQRALHTHDLFAVGLPGRTTNEPAFVLVGTKQPTSHRFSEQHPGPLVGRAEELAALRRALDELRRGQSVRLSLVAAPGLGKTKLLTHWLRTSADAGRLSGLTVCEGMGVSYASSPGWMLRSLLQSWNGTSESRNLENALVELSLSNASDALIQLARGRLPDPRRAANAIDAFFCAISGPGGFILILDDLHWADDYSLDVLRAALALPAERRLVVFSYRPSAEQRLTDLVDGSIRLRLAPLAAAEADALLRLRLQLADESVDPELRRELEHRAQGNPLYLQEALGLLRETGQLALRGTRWEMTVRGDTLRLPASVPGVILARIEHLSQHDLGALRGRQGLAAFQRGEILGEIVEIEGQVGAWLDRLETIDLGDQCVITPHLRRLQQLDFELLLLRMQLGQPRPRNARLASAVTRLECGSLETLRRQLAERLADHDINSAAEALHAAERAKLRGERATAIELYRLALRGTRLPPGYPRPRLLQDLAELEYQDGQFAAARARWKEALGEVAGDARLQPLLGLAEVEIWQGNPAAAGHLLREARRLRSREGRESQRFVVLILELSARTGAIGRSRWWTSRLDWDDLDPWLATRAALALAQAWSAARRVTAARRWLWRAVDAIPDDSRPRVCSLLSELVESLSVVNGSSVSVGSDPWEG